MIYTVVTRQAQLFVWRVSTVAIPVSLYRIEVVLVAVALLIAVVPVVAAVYRSGGSSCSTGCGIARRSFT